MLSTGKRRYGRNVWNSACGDSSARASHTGKRRAWALPESREERMDLRLDQRQHDLLRRILDGWISDLKMEISDTEDYDFHHGG